MEKVKKVENRAREAQKGSFLPKNRVDSWSRAKSGITRIATFVTFVRSAQNGRIVTFRHFCGLRATPPADSQESVLLVQPGPEFRQKVTKAEFLTKWRFRQKVTKVTILVILAQK